MAPLLQAQPSPDPESLILGHRRLARHLAQRYARSSDQREDLEQVAYVGLVKAAQRFDPAREVAFTTFATPTILGELRRFCRDTRWAVHVPRGIQEHVQALLRIEEAQHGRSLSVSEAARLLGWSEEDVLEARMAASSLRPESLNAPVRSADGAIGEAMECLGSEDSGFAAADRRDELQRALAQLTARERRVLQLRGEAGCSTPQIARQMGLSTPQASRLVGVAIRRLRAALGADTGTGAPAHQTSVNLAEAEPGLFASLDADALAGARRTAVARRVELAAGPWDGPRGRRRALGLLVLRGALLRTFRLDAKPHAELIGPGDLVRADDAPAVPAHASWQVVEPAHLAVLDRSLCRWPSVVDALLRRSAERSHALAVQLAITDLRRAEDRVLALFGVLADRWGDPRPGGVVISLSLTHDMIAMLVGVHRPTVTSTLSRLERAGRIRRLGRTRWLLSETCRDLEPAPALSVAA